MLDEQPRWTTTPTTRAVGLRAGYDIDICIVNLSSHIRDLMDFGKNSLKSIKDFDETN